MAGTCDERCRLLEMPPEHAIADLRVSRFVLYGDQTFPGYCLVILRDHATELFHLTPAVRTALLEDVCQGAEALQRALRPTKVNYAVLGNQSPHLHWHLIPRHVGDPAWPGPVWSQPHQNAVPPPERAREIVRGIRDAFR